MSYPKLGILVDRLHRQTLKGEVEWEETAKVGVYQAPFGDHTVQIHSFLSQEDGEDYVFITILNSSGLQIESFHDGEVRSFMPNDNSAYDAMKEILDTAKRHVLGTDKALDSIISILDKDEIPF